MTLTASVDNRGEATTDALAWVMVYVVFLYAIPSSEVIPALGSAGAPSMVIGLGSLLIWVMLQLRRGIGHGPRLRGLGLALFGFLACVGVSYVMAMVRPIDADEISPADVALLSVLSWTGTLLIVNDGVPSVERLRTLASRIAWAGGLLGLVGLLQMVTRQVLVDRIILPGLTAPNISLEGRGGFVRPSGTATHPIEFGVILAMILPFALHAGFYGQDAGARRLLRWLPAVVLGVSLSMTFSRSAYVSMAVGVAVMFFGWSRSRRIVVAAGGLVLGVVLFATVPRLFGTITGLFRNAAEDPSITSRTESYDIAWQFIVQAPFFGRGLGTFLPKYRIFDNQYLLLMVSIGLVGTAALLVLLCIGIVMALRSGLASPAPDLRDLGFSIAAAIAAGSVSLATFDAFAFPMTMGTLFLVLGMAGAFHQLAGPRPGSAPLWTRRPRPVIGVGVGQEASGGA